MGGNLDNKIFLEPRAGRHPEKSPVLAMALDSPLHGPVKGQGGGVSPGTLPVALFTVGSFFIAE